MLRVMVHRGRRLIVPTAFAVMVSCMWSGAANAEARNASSLTTAACKGEQKVLLVAEDANFAATGSYGPVNDLIDNRMIKRRPKLFTVSMNADGGVTISPTKQSGCSTSLERTLRARTAATTPAGGASSTSLVAACAELDRISREDAVGQPGNAKVVADVLAFYERLKQVTQAQSPSSPQIAQLDSIISQLRALQAGSPEQARTAALTIATNARTALKATCGFS
jgi:hypothetical protein